MRMRTRLLAVSLVPFLFACGGPGGSPREKVLAEVNGAQITEADFEREAETLPPYMRPILETSNGKRQFLESLITRDLLLQEALRRGVDRRPEVRGRLGQARRSILLEALLREVAEKAPGLSEEAMRKHYEENRENYEAGERARIRQILFRDRALAEDAARKAKAGESFEQLMRAAEAAGEKASDLGFVERGETDKEFEAAAFAAPANSVIGPVRTVYGFHLLQVLQKEPAGLKPFEEVREEIAGELRESAQREAFERLVGGLRKSSRVTLLGPFAGMPPLQDESPGTGAPAARDAKPGQSPPGKGR